MDDLRVAAVCMHSVPQDVAANLDRMEDLAKEASANKAHVVCFPELSVTGYIRDSPDRVYGAPKMEEIVDRLTGMAIKRKIVLIAGLIETVDGGKPYIAQMIAGPDRMIGWHRKTHLGPTETADYCPGEEIRVFTNKNTTFGVQLCYEAHFPEISTRMALMGADILFIPHASPRGRPNEKSSSWMRHLPARAFDNGIFVVACNQVGHYGGGLAFPGVALVFGPDGRVLSRYAGMKEHILYADLKEDVLQEVRTHRMKYFLPWRRPSLYAR